MSGTTPLHGPQSITDLIEKPDREIQRFLDGKPEADSLEQWINNYKAFAVEIAEWVGQVGLSHRLYVMQATCIRILDGNDLMIFITLCLIR